MSGDAEREQWNPQDRIRDLRQQVASGASPAPLNLPPPPPPAPQTTPKPPEARAVPAAPAVPPPQPAPSAAPTSAEPEADAPTTPTARRSAERPTGVTIPADLVLRVRREVSEARIARRRLTAEDIINNAISALPDDPTVVLSLLRSHAEEINFGRRPGEAGHLPTERILARLDAPVRTKVERLVASITNELGVPARRQDIWALALLPQP